MPRRRLAWALPVAPRLKFETTIALTSLELLGLGLVYGYALFASQDRVFIDAPMAILNLAGATVAVVQGWKTHRGAADAEVVRAEVRPS